jgi:hypothetical protein
LDLFAKQLFLVGESPVQVRNCQTLFGRQIRLLIACPGVHIAIKLGLPVTSMCLDLGRDNLGPPWQELCQITIHSVKPSSPIWEPICLQPVDACADGRAVNNQFQYLGPLLCGCWWCVRQDN